MKLKFKKTFLTPILLCILLCNLSFPVIAKDSQNSSTLEIASPSAVLMEASTGTICFAKNENQELPMASVTKVMTLHLIFDAISSKKIQLTDEVTISDHAASMGGSQAFMETGEKQTVETLIKCISIASANDAAVAMAETVAGTEDEFVQQMNDTAKSLHMEHTHFVNCCGLDDDNHYSCAKDLAIISRELITKHPEIFNYCTIWQEDITHTTKKGSFPFTLSNTNKLLKQYPYATGLKTGSTSKAKFCLSACATKDGMTMIAVVMAAPTPKERFADASALLSYGFAHTSIYQDSCSKNSYTIKINGGMKDSIQAKPSCDFSYITTKPEELSHITTKKMLKKNLDAPIKKGETIGTLEYYCNNEKIGTVPILSTNSVKKANYAHYLKQIFYKFISGSKTLGK